MHLRSIQPTARRTLLASSALVPSRLPGRSSRLVPLPACRSKMVCVYRSRSSPRLVGRRSPPRVRLGAHAHSGPLSTHHPQRTAAKERPEALSSPGQLSALGAHATPQKKKDSHFSHREKNANFKTETWTKLKQTYTPGQNNTTTENNFFILPLDKRTRPML